MTRTNRGSRRRQSLQVEGLETRNLMSGIFVQLNYHNGTTSQVDPVVSVVPVPGQYAPNLTSTNFMLTVSAVPTEILLMEAMEDRTDSIVVTYEEANNQISRTMTFNKVVFISEGPGPFTKPNPFPKPNPPLYQFLFNYESLSIVN
jgi:hypothetical protein